MVDAALVALPDVHVRRMAEDDQIRAPIAIDIRGARNIASHPNVVTGADEPLRRRSRHSEDGDVGRPIAVVIGGNRDVSTAPNWIGTTSSSMIHSAVDGR